MKKKIGKIYALIAGTFLFFSATSFTSSRPLLKPSARTCRADNAENAECVFDPKGSLKEIAKPYLGVYECEWLYFGGKDAKEIFDYFRAELKSDGELLLTYKTKEGKPVEIPLSYEYDYAEKTLRVEGKWGAIRVDKKFSLKNGEITVVTTLLGKLVSAKFKTS